MKKCSECSEVKSISDFGKCSKTNDGHNYKCKECKRKYDNEYHNKRTIENKTIKVTKQRLRLKKIRKFIFDYLSNKECIDCGEKRVAALEFDHRSDKSFNIGTQNGHSLKRIIIEIEKCDIRCANCHRVKTAKDFNWYNFGID